MKSWTTVAAVLAMLTPVLLGGTVTVRAQEAPPAANSQIQAVYDDLARFETQAAGASKNSANRILKLLKLTEGRLQGAPDQGDPSWQAASDRLAALKQRLDDIAAGRPAQAAAPAPATPTVEAAPSIESAPALAAGDPVVSAAAADIARISGLVDAMAPGDKVAGQQYLNELKEIGNRLRGVGNKDQAWADTAKAFNDLQDRVVDVANAPAAAPSGGAAATQTASADPNVEKVLRELGFNERNVLQMRGASTKMEERILADMERMRATLDQVADKEHPRWLEADGEWQRQMDMLAEKRLEAIEKQLTSIGEQVAGLDATVLTSEENVANFQSAIDKLAGEMKVYESYASKPGYSTTWDAHTKTAMLLQERVAKAKAAEAEFGDVKAELAAIEQRFRATPVPQALREFTDADAVMAYAETLKIAYANSVQATNYLQKIEGRTNQVDKQAFQRLKHWAAVDMPRQIERSLTETRAYLDGHWVVYQGALDFRATDDPADPNHQANRFLMEGRYEENLAQLEQGLAFVAVADALEKALGIDAGQTRLQQQAALSDAIAKYKDNFQVALSTVRMQPGIDDGELTAIAEETLKKPSYGVNLPWARLEVGKKTHRKEARSELSGNTLTTNIYEWDEFQARTAEKVGDKWYIFVNDLKYFYSGATTTPLDRWLVSKRWQSNQILEDNIDK